MWKYLNLQFSSSSGINTLSITNEFILWVNSASSLIGSVLKASLNGESVANFQLKIIKQSHKHK